MKYADPQQISSMEYFQNKIVDLEVRVDALETLIRNIYSAGGLTEEPITKYLELHRQRIGVE